MQLFSVSFALIGILKKKRTDINISKNVYMR